MMLLDLSSSGEAPACVGPRRQGGPTLPNAILSSGSAGKRRRGNRKGGRLGGRDPLLHSEGTCSLRGLLHLISGQWRKPVNRRTSGVAVATSFTPWKPTETCKARGHLLSSPRSLISSHSTASSNKPVSRFCIDERSVITATVTVHTPEGVRGIVVTVFP
jgi:hypothetical protein